MEKSTSQHRESIREYLQQERAVLAFEESVLQRRLDGRPMKFSACEAETEDTYLCRSRACVPAAEGQPYPSFERVSAGRDDLFCPTVDSLEENVQDASASLRADERYSPPIVPAQTSSPSGIGGLPQVPH